MTADCQKVNQTGSLIELCATMGTTLRYLRSQPAPVLLALMLDVVGITGRKSRTVQWHSSSLPLFVLVRKLGCQILPECLVMKHLRNSTGFA